MSFNDVHRARLLFFQALYQMHMSDFSDVADITEQFKSENVQKKYCRIYFSEMLGKYPDYREQVDKIISGLLKEKQINEVSPVELSICRLGVFELFVKHEIPYKVVITEALKIQKKYGTEEGFKFVNGLLDNASKLIREDETKT